MQFTDTSAGSPTTWNWDFGDGSTENNSAQNPVHTYIGSGIYTVILNATNENGSDIATKTGFITTTSSPSTTITGMIIHDLDHDGILEPGEPGLEGWTVYLDTDDDNEYDIAEPSNLTDINGNYSFLVEPGTYVVREILQDSWGQTLPLNPSEFTFIASAGETYGNNNFGNYQYEAGDFNVYTCRVLDSPGPIRSRMTS